MEEPLRSRLDDLRASKEVGAKFEFEFNVPGEIPRTLKICGCVLKPESEMFLLVTIEDQTKRKEEERLQSRHRERLASEVASTARELGRTQEELRILTGNLFSSHEDERRRVARELHDDISQKLAVLEIDAQRVQDRLASDPAEAIRELERVRIAIGTLSEEVRKISHALHPSVIDDLGVAKALRALVEEFREREHMIATFFAQDVPENVPLQVATGLYRITQEALRNVAKHAGKTHVKVILKGGASALRLEVIDAGEGFDTASGPSGLGMISMEERTLMMHGRFTVESKLGEGTRITVDIPWPPANG